jgi:hypothetical protein
LECRLLTDLVLALCEGDSKDSGMPILKVNALPLSRAHLIGTEPAALKEPSSSVDAFPSRCGDGCLSRYAIADAAAIAAPAVVNVKVSFGNFYLPNTSVLCREAVGILTNVIGNRLLFLEETQQQFFYESAMSQLTAWWVL